MLPSMAILFGAAMAFLISVHAGFCSVFAVMRHEPMQILAERNQVKMMSILTLKNISYRYAGMEKTVLNKISYAFETGRLYCITGASGEGKTTLLSLMAGLDLCSSGGIYCKEQDIALIDRNEYRSKKVASEADVVLKLKKGELHIETNNRHTKQYYRAFPEPVF